MALEAVIMFAFCRAEPQCRFTFEQFAAAGASQMAYRHRHAVRYMHIVPGQEQMSKNLLFQMDQVGALCGKGRIAA